MKHALIAAVLGASTLLVCGSALAQAKPEVLVKQRQAAMTLIGKYFGPLGGMAQGKVPYNADTVKRNAGYLAALSKMPWDGFNASTQDVKSRALPAVYSDSAKFKDAASNFEAAVAKLASAAGSGDDEAIKGQIKAVSKTCGGCHNDFRQKN
ncbi:MAG: cytochrome c [Burkholderiales bacterium]